jgi:cob(I)yrinic acid a,c-diamide adenosyltransferase
MTGLIHVYEGDGKGKTTAAVGLAVRCAGSGRKVLFSQFLKSDTSNELKVLRKTENIEVYTKKNNLGFTFNMTDDEKLKAREFFTNHLKDIIHLVNEGKFDLLVMDEVIDAYNLDMVSHDILTEFLKNRPQNLEVVMTGRNPKDEITELADYLTHFQKVKHPFDKGLRARVGIEM